MKMEERIPMTEVENCLICGTHIGKGNDPSICEQKRCGEIYRYEVAFDKFVKELSENQKDLPPEYSKFVDDHFWELV